MSGKYGAIPTTVDNVRFASRAEAARYRELKVLARAGKIRDLELQPRYPLVVNGITICTYVADFRYTASRLVVVEDVKSPATITPVYRLKRALMRAVYNIEIQEVTA